MWLTSILSSNFSDFLKNVSLYFKSQELLLSYACFYGILLPFNRCKISENVSWVCLFVFFFLEVFFWDLHCFCFLILLFWALYFMWEDFLKRPVISGWLLVNKKSKKLISISNLDFLIVSSKFILTILWCLLFYKFWKIKWLIYSHKKCLEYSQSLQNILILYTFNIDSVFIQPEMEKLYKTQHKDWFMKTSKNLSATILPSLNFLKSAHITINSGLPRI